jgi:hypothetical protein
MPKNKVVKSGMFSAPQKSEFPTTFHHAFHHDLPSKNHIQPTTFSKTPLKNTSKNAKTPGPHQPRIFF